MTVMDQQIPISVAVIGGGPGGMFFVHALNRMKDEMGANQNISVTCYERSSHPGGIWRYDESNSSNMYDKLWTNGCSFLIEFFDYTLDEHFQGESCTVYMKRQDLLEYMIGRVKKNIPKFFERFFKFNSEVVHVKFDECTKRFLIRVKDLVSGDIRTNSFDKCIWACGENGKPKVPQNLVAMLRDGGFEGRIIHASDTTTLEDDVKGKRILIIGGAFSAEDITLQAIKLGVDHVYVCSRADNNEITWTTKWPFNKVTTFLEQVPMTVSKKNNILLRETWWEFNGYMKYNKYEVSNEINGIDTIIFCTGYDPNLDFLDDGLKKGYPSGAVEHLFPKKYFFDAPQNWTMSQNLLTDLTGNVPLSDKLKYLPWHVHPEFYQGVLVSNPNIMFISEYDAQHPLLSIDVQANLFARYISGLKELPSAEEMRACNLEEAMEMLQCPRARYEMDENYYEVVDNLPDFWSEETYDYPEVWKKAEEEYEIMKAKKLAWMMQEASYPFNTGTQYELNENGRELMRMNEQCFYHRHNLKDDGADWKTFRDYTNGDQFYSLFTGKRAVPLKERWLNIDKLITNNDNGETDEISTTKETGEGNISNSALVNTRYCFSSECRTEPSIENLKVK
jgi:cation diffusion facilitator CzcD-associated flavoprotein CzcO